MVTLKNKIKKIESLPPENKKNISFLSIIIFLLTISILSLICYFSYTKLLPYIKKVNINKITGKKINITNCNTKDYIIINKDKSYSLSLTDSTCLTNYYEGDVIIKNNEIIFNNNIKGLIDSNYNILINGNLFESVKNE